VTRRRHLPVAIFSPHIGGENHAGVYRGRDVWLTVKKKLHLNPGGLARHEMSGDDGPRAFRWRDMQSKMSWQKIALFFDQRFAMA
jgi:hypothetical protein